MTTLAEHIIVAGAEIRPSMPEKIMLDSIDNGPLVYPTVEENGQTEPKKYSELTKAQQLQDDYDVQAKNIILHGLPPMCMHLSTIKRAHGETVHLAKEAKKFCMVQGEVDVSRSTEAAVLMENLSSCDLDVLSEVPYSDTYLNDMINQDVQEMLYSEQTYIDDFPNNEMTSDSNIIPYSISVRIKRYGYSKY
nr:hypothetical protein [Tanacetum cinerariifolium]